MGRLIESSLTGKISNMLLEEENRAANEKKICPRCGKTYTGFPAISRYDNETEICSECGTDEAMIQFMGGELENPHVFDNFMDKKEGVNESTEAPTPEEIEADEKKLKEDKKKVIENRIGELRQAIEDGVADDERQAMENEINDLENQLNASSLNEDNYEESIFSEIESAFERAGLDYTRYSDAGMMTKNLGWIVSSSEGEVNLTCAGTYLSDSLDESKKLNEDAHNLKNEVEEVVRNTFDGSDFTIGSVELGDNGVIRFNVTAYTGEDELNRDVEITVPELNYLDAVANACIDWMSEHDSPDSFYESEKLDESVTVEAVDGTTISTDDAASVSMDSTSVSITNGATTVTVTTEDTEPANDLSSEGVIDDVSEEPVEEPVVDEPTEIISTDEAPEEIEEAEELDDEETDTSVSAKSLSVLKNQGNVYMIQIESNDGNISYWVCEDFNQETNEGNNASDYANKEDADKDYFDRVGLDTTSEE